ncbi:DDE_3 domain-containing protein [Trichonephila clavipes]|nr:DDE_3 domain-containing protein [Trichonephila clavipes]
MKRIVIAELCQHLDSPISMISVRRHLHKQNIYGREAVLKPLITDINPKRRLQWYYTCKTWKKVIWSTNHLSFTLFSTTGWVHVLRTYDGDCLLPTVKHGSGSVIIWAAMSRFATEPSGVTYTPTLQEAQECRGPKPDFSRDP